MGIYYKEIENAFKAFTGAENDLQRYDNYTYHIQLYIVPETVYARYTEIKASGNSQPEIYQSIKKILSNNKVILVESGVTTYDIQSLKMVMVPPVSEENKDMIMTSAEMTLVEVDGATFMNKVAMAAMACGYESFCMCPIFLEIWFDGYRNANGEVEHKIPFRVDESDTPIDSYIISCLMQGTGTQQELNKTTYNLKFLPYYYASTNKDLQIVSNLGEVRLSNGGRALGEILQQLENKLNEKMVDLLGRRIYEEVYSQTSGDRKPISIKYDYLLTHIANRDTRMLADGTYVNAAKENIAATGSNVNNAILESGDEIIKTASETKDALTSDNLGWGWKALLAVTAPIKAMVDGAKGLGKSALEVGKGAWNNAKIVGSAVSSFWKTIAGKSYDTSDCPDLSEFIRKVIADYCVEDLAKNLGMSIFIDYNPIYIKSLLGKRYYEHQIVVRAKRVCGLKDSVDATESKINFNETAPINYTDNPISNQIEYLKAVMEGKLLLKKYNWLFSGKETNLLNVSFADNNLWYMNIGISNLNMVENTEWPTKPNFDEREGSVGYVSQIDLSDIVNADYSTAKLNFNNGVIYADDIYEKYVGDTVESIASAKQIYNIVEANDPTTAIKPYSGKVLSKDGSETENDSLNDKMHKKAQISYLVGMTNIFQMGGQRMKVNAEIMGDPYWLLPSSEFGPLSEANKVCYMPHILLCIKSNRTTTGMDEYRNDPMMEMNTLYCISKVTSTFESGRFTQNLEGFLATPFIQSSNDVDSYNAFNDIKNKVNTQAVTTDNVPEEGN